MTWLEGPPEGSPTRDESRSTEKPITLDALTQLQDQRFKEHINCMYQRFDGFIDDLRRDRQSEALPGQQARPEGEDAYNEESGELEHESTADGEIRVTRSENQPKIEPDLVQHKCIGQQENNPALLSMTGVPVPTTAGENLNGEPMLQSAGVNNGGKSIKQEEATSTSSNT